MIQPIFALSRQQGQTKVNKVIKLNGAANETYLIPQLLNQSGLRAESLQEINKYMSVYFSITGSDPFYFSHIFKKQ